MGEEQRVTKPAPARVEVGQRYYVGDNPADNTCTIIELLDGGASARMHWDSPLGFTGLATCKEILKRYIFLGGPSPSPTGEERPAPAAGQRWRSKSHGGTLVVQSVSQDRIAFLWENGCHFPHSKNDGAPPSFFAHPSVEFVDHGPTPAPTGAGTAKKPDHLLEQMRSVWDKLTPAKPNDCCYGFDGVHSDDCDNATTAYRGIGETRALDGTPLSCLGAVPCLRSSEQLKPVEPWVPSDPWADIPDAGPVRR